MTISYRVSEVDFVRAGQLMMKKRTPQMRFFPWLGGVLVLVIFATMATNPVARASALSLENVPKLIFGLGCPLLMLSLPWLSRWGFQKQYRKSPVLAEQRYLLVDDVGLDFQSASASGRVVWTVYCGYSEDAFSFLLMQQGSAIFIPIPKRELTVLQVDDLRAHLILHLPRK